MNLSKNDMFVMVAMSIVVIMMSFTFPALGMTGTAQNESDIPEFNVSKGSVDFAREEPEYPARPSEGTLRYVNGSEAWEDNRQVYLQRGSPEYLVSFFDDDPGPGDQNVQFHVNLIKFNGSTQCPCTNDKNINTSESKTITAVGGAYEIGINNLDVIENNGTNQTAEIDWQVLEQPSDQTWLGRLPIVGGIISGTNQLASVVGWIASIIWFGVTKVLVTIGNALLMFANTILYFIDFSWWLISTYGNIVGGAPTAWASVIVAIPGIVLGYQFTKFIAVGIKLLPFT